MTERKDKSEIDTTPSETDIEADRRRLDDELREIVRNLLRALTEERKPADPGDRNRNRPKT